MTLQIVIGYLSLVRLKLVGDGRQIVGSDPRVWPAIALVSSGFFDEKPDNFFIRYRVKGAQIVETTLPCSFASFPAIASEFAALGEAFNAGEVDILQGMARSNLGGWDLAVTILEVKISLAFRHCPLYLSMHLLSPLTHQPKIQQIWPSNSLTSAVNYSVMIGW